MEYTVILLSIAAVAMAIAAFITLRTDRNRRGMGNGHRGEE